MIKAITFDFWDTLFFDGSDEAKRKEAGKLSKPDERRRLFKAFISEHRKDLSDESVLLLFNCIEEAFNKNWRDEWVTWPVLERFKLACRTLNINPSMVELKAITLAFEEMELDPTPDLVPHVRETLVELKKKYKLGIISDTIYSPGATLRKMLEKENMLGLFDVFVFSDEAGHSKPHPHVFETATRGLHIVPVELVHVGDRAAKDIDGPLKFGAHGVLCQAAIKREQNADGCPVFDDYRKLPELIAGL